MAPEQSGDFSAKQWIKAGGMTPGVWLGIVGYLLMVAASLLPWYNISARVPVVSGFEAMTTIIQFDGLNGLYVHPLLKEALGLGVPGVGFPFAILFLISAFFKIRKLIRSNEHKMRASTLFRSSILILLPLAATLIAIAMLPSLIPAAGPAEVQALAHAVAAQPFGGSTAFTFDAGALGSQQGELQWGFGLAIYVMIAAAVLMNLGSQLELRAYRRAKHELELGQAEGP